MPRVALDSLPDLPGFAHAVLVETGPDGGRPRVLTEIGADEGTADAVLAWGRRAGAVATDRDLALDDVIVTTDRAHHLLRAVQGSEGVWVYLRVHRDGGNLALARRRLTALTAVPAPAASRAPARQAGLPAGPSSTAVLPGAPPAPSATPAANQSAPANRSAPWPVRIPATTRTPAAPATARPPVTGPATPTGTAALAPAALAPAALPASPPGPLARASPHPSAAPPTPPPSAPPPTRPAPPTLPAPRRPAPADALPAGPAPPADRAVAAPEDSAGVLGQRWRTDPETLRRVLAGLLRLGRTPQTALAGAHPESTTRSPGAAPTRRNP